MSLRLPALLLAAPLLAWCPQAPTERPALVAGRPRPTPDPRAVLTELEKEPARCKTLADGWRAFTDPRTGFAEGPALAANARRLLLAWAVQDRDTHDWPRLIALTADVEAKLPAEARAGWARIV